MRNLNPTTILRYRRNVLAFCEAQQKEDGSEINLNEIDTRCVFQYLQYGKAQKKWKARTIRGHRMSLWLFFDWLRKNQAIDLNPIQEIASPRIPQQMPRSLAHAQAISILDSSYTIGRVPMVRSRNRCMISLMLFAGLRRSEVAQLNKNDIDIQEHRLHLRQTKGNKERIIPIGNKLEYFLLNHLAFRNKEPEFKALFLNSAMTAPVTDSCVKELVKQICQKTGLSFSAHQLRHTFATQMLEKGTSLSSLAQMMGHSHVQTTAIYLSVTKDLLKNEITKHPLG